jgi:DNA-binding transcriptional LysR family regulator
VAPRLGRLLERHPDLAVELCLADNVDDMVQSGLDLAIRVGEVTDTSLVARRIGSAVGHAVAATAYLDRHGEPRHPRELSTHHCLLFTRVGEPAEWVFDGPDGPVTVGVQGRLRSDSIEVLAAAAAAGLGIARVPMWMVGEQIASGRMRRILPEWRIPPRPIFAVYPSRRLLAARTRAVLDFLIEESQRDDSLAADGRE